MRFIGELRAFLTAIWQSWIASMSGIGGLIAWVAGATLEPMPVSMRWALMVIGTSAVVVACFLVWQNERRARLAEQSGKELREAIGKLLWEGQKLMAACAKDMPETIADMVLPHVPKHAQEAEDWKNRTEALLEARLDFSYVARFRDPTHVVPIPEFKPGQPAELMAMIYVRVFRLGQFLGELVQTPLLNKPV